ncbi:cation transporter [Vibrio rumoiensis]|nr:copper-translocating P-type ATPase [Vibrio rumoiensis]
MVNYQLQLHGLNCMGCAKKARNAFESLDNTTVLDISALQAQVQTTASLDELNQALSSLGYQAFQTLHFQLSGLSCGRCVNKVQESLNNTDSIDQFDVDKTSLKITSQLEADTIVKLISDLGYQAELVAIKAKLDPSDHEATKEVEVQKTEIENLQNDNSAQASSTQQYQQFLISGMTCASCVSSVEKGINKVDSVQQAQVNLAEQTAWVIIDPQFTDQALVEQEQLIINAIKQTGYHAEIIKNDDEMRAQQQQQFEHDLKTHRQNAIAGLIVGVPLMAWGMLGGNMMINSATDQWAWGIIGILCLILLATAGKPFFSNALQALSHKRATMDTLVALGTGAAWLYSIMVTLFPDWFPTQARHVYYEASAMIIGLISLGHYIEAKAKARTNDSLQSLINLQPKTAIVIIEGKETSMPVNQIQAGMHIRVKPGDKMPIDGKVISGESYVDESMLTGEPIACMKNVEDHVFAGTVNQDGSLIIEATMVGEQTSLARIIQLVRQAQSSKPALAKLADKISAVFVPVVIAIALFAAAIWYVVGPEPQISYMLVVVTTVLIIACPCALGLATPLSITVGVGKAAEMGILIKNAEVLQTASQIQTVVFDKTGTLTQGKPSVQQAFYFDDNGAVSEGNAEDTTNNVNLLSAVYNIESQSEHPLAQAVCQYIDGNISTVNKEVSIHDFKAERGLGVSAKWNQSEILIGSPRYLTGKNVDMTTGTEALASLNQQAHTPIVVAINGKLSAVFGVADPIRDDSKQTISALKALGIKVVMLSGDSKTVAEFIGQQLGIDQVIAEVLPHEKAEKIQMLQQENGSRIVAMVGDGINDAPALAQADVSIAMGSGSDVAIESASMTLLNSSPIALVNAIALSKATLRNIKQNLLGAFIYNTLGIPIAAGVLYPAFGFLLSPVVAGAAMALSSITVVSNANRLRLFKPKDK